MDDEEMQVIRECAEQHWLLLEYQGNAPIRVSARALDRILADGHRLVLEIGRYSVALHVKSRPDAARVIVEQLQQYTRSAPIRDDTACMLAKRRIAAATTGQAESTESVLLLGDTEITAREDQLCAGVDTCNFEEVHAGAQRRETLQLPNGSIIQAALALLAFAHQCRVEDIDLLSKRVAEYERKKIG